jgi:transmembrane sensor
MLHLKDLEIIERYINGLANIKEKRYVGSLFSNGEDNQLLRQTLEKDWDKISDDPELSGVDFDKILEDIQNRIKKNKNQKSKKLIFRIYRIYMKVAAILLVPLFITGTVFYFCNGKNLKTTPNLEVSSNIYAPLGSRVTFNLPDGTKGMLNSGSNLTYSLPFNSKRKVKLEGEAWFEVVKDEVHPFEINTGNSIVKVFGTAFNLSAYPAENYVEVVLKNGKMEFQDKKGNGKETLLPSERLIFQNGVISKSITDPAKYCAWTKGMLVFRGDSMAEIARRLERWYNVKVEIADKGLENYSFRATFEDDKIEDVLAFLAMTSPIKYQIAPRHIRKDGKYEKEIVKIYFRK